VVLCISRNVSALIKRVRAKFEKRLLASSLSIRPPVSPHGTNRLQMDGCSWNLTFEYFRKFVEKIQVLLKSDKNDGYFA